MRKKRSTPSMPLRTTTRVAIAESIAAIHGSAKRAIEHERVVEEDHEQHRDTAQALDGRDVAHLGAHALAVAHQNGTRSP